MLLPFEFLFPRGFLRQTYLLFFPSPVFLSWNFRVNFRVTWELVFEEFWCNVLERYLWNFVCETVYVRTANRIMEIVTERKYFMDWRFFLDLTSGFDFLILLESVLCGSRTFTLDFVSSLSQSKARHLESIFGTIQDCTWELGSNTLEASCEEFVSLIKDFTGGFYWLVNQELSFGTVCVKD